MCRTGELEGEYEEEGRISLAAPSFLWLPATVVKGAPWCVVETLSCERISSESDAHGTASPFPGNGRPPEADARRGGGEEASHNAFVEENTSTGGEDEREKKRLKSNRVHSARYDSRDTREEVKVGRSDGTAEGVERRGSVAPQRNDVKTATTC